MPLVYSRPFASKAVFSAILNEFEFAVDCYYMEQLRDEKVKAISTLVTRTRFARSSNTYITFTSCQNAACSSTFFFLASRLCSRGFYVLTEQM